MHIIAIRRRETRLGLALTGALCLFISTAAAAEDAQLAPNAPKDKLFSIEQGQADTMRRLLAPLIAQARATYPATKQHFLAGLPPGQILFVTAPLRDSRGVQERAFIRVQRIENGRIYGTIANDLMAIHERRLGDRYDLPEEELIDWTIAKPDGTEDGNLVGKFLDTYQAR